MSRPEETPREKLYRNWFEWVTTNLGRDAQLASIAATAATDAAEAGRGFNGASESARAAWIEAAKSLATQPGPNEERKPPGTQWRRFGCGLAVAVAVLLALLGVFLIFAMGSLGGCVGPKPC